MPAPSAQLLAPHARALLFDPPTDRDEALRRCALAPGDLALVRRHRRSHNRLGFAVQLALVRDLGRPLRLDETPPAAVVEAVADQLGIEPAVFALYARRDGTRREHAGEIAALLDLRGMRQADYRPSIRAAATCAVGTDRGEPIVRAVIEDLKERRITVPAPALVERLALAGRAWARRQSHRDLARGLNEAQRALLEALLTDRAEESSRGLTIHQLNLVIDRHVRPETYAAALAAVVDAQHAQPFAAVWGPGSTSSSDGQFFPASGRGEAMSDYNARQGSEPGSVFYGFISDRFASYYSRVIAATASEAPYVLDGLMHHESAVEIHEHATDTAGAVESIFALAHAFGYRFAPRIRDLGERKLDVADRAMAEGLPDAVLGGLINRTTVEENWAEVLRLAASIRAGIVPPSVILKKLAAFPRQNALHRALREMGRLERAIFTCDWLLDPELRRRSNGNLNKGESRHALARAVFFHRLGELRDRTAEDMAHRASGLNLVVNAIVLWNTTYLARAVAYVRGQGVALTDEELSHVAPVRWDHIALTGDYLWSDVQTPRDRFRPLRTSRFRPEAFRASSVA